MALWLFKEEPDHYSFTDLQRDGQTLWDGVANALARQHLRNVKRGDRVLYYHTGKEKAVVGIARVVTGAKADPADEDPKAVVVEVAPVRPLARPVALSAIKADPLFKDWELVRMPRLSVMPVTEEQWQRIEEMGRTEPK
jgi:predicted RNA-binding protein with PUA-like domain